MRKNSTLIVCEGAVMVAMAVVLNFLNAVTVTVTFQYCHHPAALMEPGLDIFYIVPQRMEPYHSFCPPSQLSHREIPLSRNLNAIYYSIFCEYFNIDKMFSPCYAERN